MKFQSLQEAFAYLESFTNLEQKPIYNARTYRLDRMQALLPLFDHPERSFRAFHLAGSKGKGSTAAFLASILREAGYRTGLYMSPHLLSYRERITEAGRPWSDHVYIEAIDEIRSRIACIEPGDLPGDELPTTFELLTLLAFLIFRQQGCSWAVLETGLGGRLDATNVITPAASLLTIIEKEHTEYLGDTLAAIAGEKAGIIKPGVPVFSADQKPEVAAVFRRTAVERQSPLLFLSDEVRIRQSEPTESGTRTLLEFERGLTLDALLGLTGRYQAGNAALAVLAAQRVLSVDPEAIKAGLSGASLPGRFDIRKLLGRTFVFDGAHTPQSVRGLLEDFRSLYPGPAVLIFGAVAGKDHRGMAEILAGSFASIIISTPGRFKPGKPAEVYAAFREQSRDTLFEPDPQAALQKALALSDRGEGESPLPILVAGSFYMAAEILSLPALRRDEKKLS